MLPWTKKKLEILKLLPDEMKQRGEYLLLHPRQGKRTLSKTPVLKTKLKSNCFGTTIFLRGENAINKCKTLYKETDTPFVAGSIKEIPTFYWPDNTRPGLAEINIMQDFLRQYCKETDNPRPGDIMVVNRYFKKDGFWLAHTGIWTGIEDYVLEQHNMGEKFGLEKLSKHYRPYFVSEN